MVGLGTLINSAAILAGGVIGMLAVFIKPYMTELALDYIALVGSILIFCVGLNLIREKKIRVANMLPAIVLAYIAALLPF